MKKNETNKKMNLDDVIKQLQSQAALNTAALELVRGGLAAKDSCHTA
jgi:hypothetical protein